MQNRILIKSAMANEIYSTLALWLRQLTKTVVFIGLSLIIGGGCTATWPLKNQVLESGLSPNEMRKYHEAVNAYQTREYETADELFTSIREQTVNPVASRMALYGLACTRLMMASTPEEYQKALALWTTWVQCAPNKYDRENPVLFDPIIEKKMVFSLIPLKADNGSDDEDPSQWFMLRANNELQKLKFQLENAQHSIENRDAKLKALEKEITRLNEQIKALETIDQKIQKKKNAIPSAD